MILSIVGTGYVGLVTGAVLADFGHTVYCLDIDQNRIEGLKIGKIPFYEPGLEELVTKNYNKKRLIFTTDYSEAITESEVVFICVGTPPKPNGEADLSYLLSASEQTAKALVNPTLIVIKSTAPIGVEVTLKEVIDKHTSVEYEFASCPEFLKEGTAVADTIHPDRIIIGVQTEKAGKKLMSVYEHFNGQRLICDLRSAQMIKYAANSFLAMKISFANVIATLSERLDADALVVLKGIGLDPRIGSRFLQPGIGFGGSCFPKDVSAFIEIASNVDYDFELLKAVQVINQGQIDRFVEKISTHLRGVVTGKTVAALGLAFKPDTDDVRESAAIKVIQKLLKQGAKIKAYDPMATDNAKKILGEDVEYCSDAYQATEDADILILLTEWNEFKELDFKKIIKLMKQPVVIDGRNIYDAEKLKSLRFTYQGVGKLLT